MSLTDSISPFYNLHYICQLHKWCVLVHVCFWYCCYFLIIKFVHHLCCLVTDIEVDEDVEQEDKPGVQNLSISVFYKRQSSQVKVLFISLLLRAFTSNSAESSDRDDNSGLSISDCMEKCWNNCSCVGFTTSNSNASPEKFSGFQIKHSRFQIVNWIFFFIWSWNQRNSLVFELNFL